MSTRRTFLTHVAAATALTTVGSQTRPSSGEIPAVPDSVILRKYAIAHTDLVVSRIAMGCANLADVEREGSLSSEEIDRAALIIHTAYQSGITLFDVADVYGSGRCEIALGEVLRRSPSLRRRIVIQSKCGVRFNTDPQWSNTFPFDCSRAHIVDAVRGSLKRLQIDHLDILLLHYPDALVDPLEVARAFDDLHRDGKVRFFGVSNHTASQIELLKTRVKQPIVTNQVQLSLGHSYLITDGLEANRDTHSRITRGYSVGVTGTLDYCRMHDIRIQAYSPIRGDLLKPAEDATPEIKGTVRVLADLASRKGTTPPALALAWLLRHPAGIVPIIGAGDPKHIVEDCSADHVELTREEWYTLLASAATISDSKLGA